LRIELHQLELRYQALRAVEPSRRRKLLSAVCETGQQVPVVVVAAATADRYVLIDGYLRVDVMRSLGRDVVEATVWSLGETEALIARFHLEGHARSALEEAWLLEHLAKDEGLSLEELGRRLCRTKSWVSRRLGLRKILTAEVQAKVAAGQIPAQAAMKYLLPLARANAEHSRKLVAGLGAQRVSVRQMGRLYAAYRAADAVGRERLCNSPLVFLQMEAQAERSEVERAMREFGDYAVRHFSRDEDCTLRGACPALEWNGMARAEMIRIIAEFRNSYERDGATPIVAGRLSDELCGWVSKYIPGPDAASLPCVVAAR